MTGRLPSCVTFRRRHDASTIRQPLSRLRQMPDEFARVDRQIGLTPHADRQLADRPLVDQFDRVDRHGLGKALGRRRRDDADADIAFDEAADGVEAAQLDAQFETAADPVGLLGQKALQGAGSIETDEIEIERLGESDLSCRR